MNCGFHCSSVSVMISDVSYISDTCFITIIRTILNVWSEDDAVVITVDVYCST